MRRGFKSWCEKTSADYRAQLGLSLNEPLDPRALAAELGVLVWTPHDIPHLSKESLIQLTRIDSASWSAITIAVENKHLVILNSAHADTRLNNSLAHELSHIILNHRPATASVSAEGYLFRDKYDHEQEDEANWLAGALLVPREGLRQGYSDTAVTAQLAVRFGVSAQLILWRLRMTGVVVQSRRAAGRRRP